MKVKTKVLVIEVDPEGVQHEYWDKFTFDITNYAAHVEHDEGSVLYLKGVANPFIVKLSYWELSKQLDFLNTFEYINLN